MHPTLVRYERRKKHQTFKDYNEAHNKKNMCHEDYIILIGVIKLYMYIVHVDACERTKKIFNNHSLKKIIVFLLIKCDFLTVCAFYVKKKTQLYIRMKKKI